MRLIAYLSGTLGSSLFVMGCLFKMMHWPFATLLLVLGLSLIGLVAIPLSAYYKYNKGKQNKYSKLDNDALDEDLK
jgi:hypothetical protein